MTINILYNILRAKTYIIHKYKNNILPFKLEKFKYKKVEFNLNLEERYTVLNTKYKNTIVEYYLFFNYIPKWESIKISSMGYPEPIIIYDENILKKDDYKEKKNIVIHNVFETKHIVIDFFKNLPIVGITVLSQEIADGIKNIFYDSYKNKDNILDDDIFYKLFYHPVFMDKIYGYELIPKNPISGEVNYHFIKQ